MFRRQRGFGWSCDRTRRPFHPVDRLIGEEVMLDTLHQAAVTAREQNTGVAAELIDRAGLTGDATLLTALEALLNVLPPVAAVPGKKKPDEHLAAANSDFEALEKLRRLAFAEEVPAPKELQRVLPGMD